MLAISISILLSVGINYFGGPYFDKLAIENRMKMDNVDKNITLRDFFDDIGDFFELALSVVIIIGCSMFIYYFINKKILYITDISESLNIIGGGNLKHTIPVKGNNEIASLAKSINRMSAALEQHIEDERKILQSEQRLITGISHDLRAPLSSVIGYVYVLKDKQYRTEEEQAQYLEVVLEKSLRVQKLLDDLLEMATLQESEMSIQTMIVSVTDFENHFVDYIATELRNNCPNVSEVFTRYSNQKELKQIVVNNMFTYRVLDNVISNISKYATSEMPVEIQVKVKSDYIELKIANHCEERILVQADKLTERFFKVDSSRSAEDGSGLGLNICKEIMEKQRGYLRMETNLNEGQIIVVLGFLIA